MNKKIAIINQRYGLEVNGGSELYSRQIAERLTAKYDVEVLTSCAIEYVKWSNHYKEGVEIIKHKIPTVASHFVCHICIIINIINTSFELKICVKI